MTRPGSRTSRGACTRPAWRSCRPGRRQRSIAADRGPGHAGRGADRLPGVPRRAGQDAAPAGARGHPGRPAPRHPPGAARRARHRAVRPRRGEPLSVQRDRRERRRTRRVRGADRHRRPFDGASGGEEPPVRRRGRRSRPLSGRARGRALPAGSRSTSDAGWRPRPSRTPRPTTRRWRPGSRCKSRQRTTRAGRQFAGFSLTRSAVLRYGENPHQRAALYRSADRTVTGLGRRRAAARQGDELQQLRRRRGGAARGPRLRATLRRHREAHQPVRHRGRRRRRRRRTRKANACDPVSAFGGVIATNRPVTTGDGAASRGDLHRGGRRTGFRGPARSRSSRARSRCGCCVVPDYGHAPRRVATDLRWGARAGGGHPERARRRPGRAGRWPPAPQPTSAAGARSSSPGGRCARSSRTRSCSRPTARRLASGWGRSTGSTPPGSRSAGPAIARRDRSAASDAFFPFADGLQVLIDAGVRAVVQPGGSMRDDEVIAAATAAGLTLYLTGTRHFLH